MTDMQKLDYDFWGLSIYEIDGAEYAIANDEAEAVAAAKEYIKESLWAFNTKFILEHNSKIIVSERLTDAFVKMQQELCEECNEICLALIDDLDEFVQNAITSDGLGHFLSQYDGNQQDIYIFEQEIIDYIVILDELEVEKLNNVLVFRIN
jgi:hypothetical protein